MFLDAQGFWQRKQVALPALIIVFELATYLSMDMYVPSLPTLALDFAVSDDKAYQTIIAWFFGMIFLELLVGPVSDKLGRRPVLLVGVLLFMLGSIICTLSVEINWFILGRFLQGMAVAVPLVVGYAAIHESFNDQQAMRIISIMGSITVLAPSLGPMLGSLIMHFSSWRLTFLLLSLWSFVLFLLMLYKLPETLSKQHAINVQEVLRGYAKVITDTTFLSYMLPSAIGFAALVIWIIGSPFALMQDRGVPVLLYGVIQCGVFSCYIIGSKITRVMLLMPNMDATRVVKLGYLVMGTSSLLMLIISQLTSSVVGVIISMMLVTMGFAIFYGPVNRLAITHIAVPMGYRTAMATTTTNLMTTLGAIFYTFVNAPTMTNLVYVVVIVLLASCFAAYLAFAQLAKRS